MVERGRLFRNKNGAMRKGTGDAPSFLKRKLQSRKGDGTKLTSSFIYCHCGGGGAPMRPPLQCNTEATHAAPKGSELPRAGATPMKEIRLISCGLIGHVSDIKLIRTDTTLDLSQKAEKGMISSNAMLCFL